MRGLALDRRLRPASPAPLAVAVSGGGDSLALALVAADWAAAHGRKLVLVNIDHGLQAASHQWTEYCRDLADRLGAGFRAMAWEGPKPAAGLPAAARAARHALLAQAAREAGAKVILLGHTADDRAEAAAMRGAGSTVPDPREWSPSPAWPEGRGLFLLRPLIQVGRAEIRAWLRARGETWIEDPANQDPRYARARARAAGAGEAAAAPEADDSLPELARGMEVDAAGVLSIPRERLRGGATAFIGMACLCAAGSTRPPRRERLERLAQALAGDGPVAATLAGARIEADAATVRFLRDAGEAARGGLAEVTITRAGVWDGRFEIATGRPVTVRRLGGLAARLSKADRAALAMIPAKARAALPAVVEGDAVSLAPARPLAYDRLLAAAGAVPREP